MGGNVIVNANERRPYLLEIVMILIAIAVLFPIYYLLATTFKTPEEATNSPLGFPRNFTLENYIYAWKAMNYPKVFLNNLIITTFSLLGGVFLPCIAAYSLARSSWRASRFIYGIFVIGLLVPFQIALLPLYKLIISLNLIDTLLAVILINISMTIPFNIFLFTAFVKTLPIEVEESASIDGSGVIRTFIFIVLPLMQPVIASALVLNALSSWNDFMGPLLFLQSRDNSVILLEVSRNIGQFSTNWTGFFPMLVLGIMPLLLFYILMQKYIIRGIVAGSVKG